MKTLLVTVALAIVALPSLAAIEYEFVQKSSSDDHAKAASELNARVTVDGLNSRYDFIGGNMYPPGTYAISTDGSRRFYFIDPTHKWYTEVDTSGVANSLGSSSIKIENFKASVEPLADTAQIAGIDTQRYRQTISYDITVPIRGMALKQHVRTEIDSWTTTRYPDLHASVLSNAVSTGNPSIDALIEAETTKIAGFPMRQIVKIRVNSDVSVRSKLEVPTTKTITRESWVTSIREVKPSGTAFTVPVTYRRADQPDLPRTAAKILTFEPPSK